MFRVRLAKFSCWTLTNLASPTNPNRLLKVGELGLMAVPFGSSPNMDQFLDKNKEGDDYIYDDNGNMIEDKNKKIKIAYNYLNLPQVITFEDGPDDQRAIVIVYDATGKKQRKLVLGCEENQDLIGIDPVTANPVAVVVNTQGPVKATVKQIEQPTQTIVTIQKGRGRAGAVWVPSNPDNTSTNDPVTTTGDPAPSDNPEDPASDDNGGEWLTQDVHVDFEGYNECLPLYYQDCIKLHTCSVKDYVGGFVYIGSELEGFYFEEGRITTANEDEAFQQIDFFYKDHLGSPRSIYREDTDSKGNKNGEPIVIQESHYYPFGGKLQGISPRIEEPEVTYQYNGKELTDEFGLNWTDYGARWLDVELGRWFVVDPLAEKYYGWSGYNYVMGNPIIFIDPNGMEVYFITYTGGSGDAYDAALTRKNEIEGSKSYDPEKDHVYFLEVSDLGKLEENINSSLKDAEANGYGKTVEFSVFGHGGTDGPVGNEEASQGNLADVTGDRGFSGDQKQVSPSYWKNINFNFDTDNSFACFYSCNGLGFAEKFLAYQPSVKYTSGLDGGAGGSLTDDGDFKNNGFNFFGRPTYMVTVTSGKVDPKYVFSRNGIVIDRYMDVEGNRIPMRKPSFEVRGNLSLEKMK